MKIHKYNKPKDNSSTGRASGGITTIINGSASDKAGYSEEAKKLSDTHLIFGLPFNGTLDVAGDLSNVQNINAVGGDVSVLKGSDGSGGNINAAGDITASNNVIGKMFIGDVDAKNVITNNLVSDEGDIGSLVGNTINYNSAEFKEALINTLQSIDITTDYLTVNKQAHFFELIIDKIKAAGGAVLLSPADGFKVDKVINIGSTFRLLWRSSIDDKKISNMWRAGDLAICLTFNAAEGTSYNVSNKYYWALVVNVGTTIEDGLEYHFIDLAKSVCDGTLNPEVGDEIAQLGYRGSDDVSRLSAIYLAAYNSIDPTLKAPLICQYKGITDFNLPLHKYTWFAANGSEIRGNLKVESGLSLLDYVDNHLPSAGESAYLHTAYSNSSDGSKDFTKVNLTGDYLYIGLCSNFKVSDEDLTYTNYTWSRLKGDAVDIVGTSVEYAVGDSGTDAPTSGWQTTVPYTPPTKFLWTKTSVFYSNGDSTVSFSVGRFGSDGGKGDLGNSYTDNLLLGTQKFEGDNWVNLKYWLETGETYKGCKVYKRELNLYGIYQIYNVVEGNTYTFSSYVKSDGGDARAYFSISSILTDAAEPIDTETTTQIKKILSNRVLETDFAVGDLADVELAEITNIFGTVTPIQKDIPEASTWTRQAVTFKCTKSGYIGCRILKATGTGAIYVAGYKLEDGENKNAVWTPAASELVGLDSVRYYLMPTASGFKKESNGCITPDMINVKAYKLVGSNAPEEFNEGAVRVTILYDDGTEDYLDEDSGEYTISADDVDRYGSYAVFRFELVYYDSILDTVSIATTADGEDADYYKLVPVVERALVLSSNDLEVTLGYLVAHIVGKNSTMLFLKTNPTSSDMFIRFKGNTESSYKNLHGTSAVLIYTNLLTYSNTEYQQQYQNNRDEIIEYFTVLLMSGTRVLDTRIIPVLVNAAAILEITDKISARVSNNTTNINKNTNDIAQLEIKADSISSTVSQHTTTINNLNGLVETNTKNISTLLQTANGLKSTVESHTTTLGLHTTKISEIEQTAENIRLLVEDVALRIDGKKIVLDGNTEVNGTVNVNKDGTGFKLNGSGGESFTIGSNDIGTYSNFENKTVYSFWHNIGSTIAFSGSGTISKSFEFGNSCTNLKVGQRIRITNLGLGKTDYNFANSSIKFLTVSIFYGNPSNGNQVAIGTSQYNVSNGFWYLGSAIMSGGSKSAILDYTANRLGEYWIRINGEISGNGGGLTELNLMLGCEISLNAFGTLTYNGFGFNFGGGKIAFIGDDAMIFKMGNKAGLKITEADGLQRWVPESITGSQIIHRYTNSNKWIGTNDYVVRVVTDFQSGGSYKGTVDIASPKDEMLVVKAITNSIIIVLPNAASYPGKSYLVKNYSSSNELYVSGGSLTTTNALGNIIVYNSASGYNDACTITTTSGSTTYRGLMKCNRHAHKLVSDGSKWIDFLMSN